MLPPLVLLLVTLGDELVLMVADRGPRLSAAMAV